MIIYGYFWMIFASLICCFSMGFIYMYRSWSVYTVEEEEEKVDDQSNLLMP